MIDPQPKCRDCGNIRIAGMEICRECWERFRAEALKPDPKNDAAKDEKETGRMEFER